MDFFLPLVPRYFGKPERKCVALQIGQPESFPLQGVPWYHPLMPAVCLLPLLSNRSSLASVAFDPPPLHVFQPKYQLYYWWNWLGRKWLGQLLLLFSHPVMSDSSQPHGLQLARPLCPSQSLRVCLSSCSLHLWCHPTCSSSDILFSFCPQTFPATGTLPVLNNFFITLDNDSVEFMDVILSINGYFLKVLIYYKS